MVEYKKMDLVDGKLVEVESKEFNPQVCPNLILMGDHYINGTCQCFNPEAIELKKLGYAWNEDKGHWDSSRKMAKARRSSKVKQKKCVCCEEKFNIDDMRCTFDNEDICESCLSSDECEPVATIHHLMSNYEDDYQRIGRYFNETDGDFTVSYHSTDGWRGYYNVHSDTYTKVHDDCALAYSEDERNLKQFDEFLTDLAIKHKIGIVRAVSRTSNLFSSSVDYFVHNTHLDKFNKLMDKINSVKKELRDPVEFHRTAIMGE